MSLLPPTSETLQYLRFLESKPTTDFAVDLATNDNLPETLTTKIAGRTWEISRSNASSSRNEKHLNIIIRIMEAGERTSRNKLQIVIFHDDDSRPLSQVTGALFKALLVKGVNYLALTRTRMVQLNSDFEGVSTLWNALAV